MQPPRDLKIFTNLVSLFSVLCQSRMFPIKVSGINVVTGILMPMMSNLVF